MNKEYKNLLEEVTTKILNSIAGMIIFIISLAAFYLPYEIRIIPQIAEILTPVRYACAAVLLVFFFLLYGSSLTVFRRNWALWAAAGFVGVLIFSTYMHGGDMEGAVGTYGLAGLFLIMNVAVFFRVNPKKYLLIAFLLFLVVNIVNTYTVYAYWGVGMWETYGLYRNTFYSLIGNYNGGIEYVIPMAICGSAYAHRYGIWLELLNYPAMIMSLIMSLKCDSVTQIVAFALILAFMLLGDFALISKGLAKVIRVIFQPVILVGLDLMIFVSIIMLNRTNWVEKLGIDPTFHNRRHIWNMSMDWIGAEPVWGNGQETVAVEAGKITGYAHSHSTYLEVAYKTGFIGSVFMLLMLVAAVVAIYRNKHSRVSFMMTGLLFIMGIAAIFETYPMVYVMLCLGLIYYVAKNTSENDDIKGRIMRMKTQEYLPGAGEDDLYKDRLYDETIEEESNANISTTGRTESRKDKIRNEITRQEGQSASESEKTDADEARNSPFTPDVDYRVDISNIVDEVQAGDVFSGEVRDDPDIDDTVHIDDTVIMK